MMIATPQMAAARADIVTARADIMRRGGGQGCTKDPEERLIAAVGEAAVLLGAAALAHLGLREDARRPASQLRSHSVPVVAEQRTKVPGREE